MSQQFTTAHYRELVKNARDRFGFITFANDLSEKNIVLWRHDVDFSPQRALALARIESELGVKATYFVQLTSYFYSLFDPEIVEIFKEISALGHDMGIHFDPLFYKTENTHTLGESLILEKNILENLLGTQVAVMSFHNPPTFHNTDLEQPEFAGMINASAPSLRKSFEYCSDSNGLWRFRNLADVIKDHEVQRLYALTHPCWWTDDDLTPYEKVKRCIDGRARRNLQYYDQLLETHGRPNIGKKQGEKH